MDKQFAYIKEAFVKEVKGVIDRRHSQPTTITPDQTEMGVQRTLMAANRTLLAWVRTGISQITFGFTIYKILQSFESEGKYQAKHAFLTSDKVGAILLIVGIAAIVFGVIECKSVYREYHRRIRREPVIMAGMIAALGVVFLTAIFFKA